MISNAKFKTKFPEDFKADDNYIRRSFKCNATHKIERYIQISVWNNLYHILSHSHLGDEVGEPQNQEDHQYTAIFDPS